MTVKADIVETGFKFSALHEVTDIHYSGGRLTINVKSLDGSLMVTATFPEVAGFRVLDEGDLLEFWQGFSSKEDWIFRVIEGGWFEQEGQRSGFIRRDVKAISEFMITGVDDCVSVLAWAAPEVSGRAV